MSTATIDRTAHLEQTIKDAETELAQLRSTAEAVRRKNAQKAELEQFRANVDSQRKALAHLDSTIEETIDAIKAEANSGVVLDQLGLGIVINGDQSKAAARILTDKLMGLVLAHAVRARQLANLEAKLEGMERVVQRKI